MVEGEGKCLGVETSSEEGTTAASWGEHGAAGVFCCIFLQELSKTIFLVSHCTTEMQEAAV